LFTPLETKEALHDWVRVFLGLDIPAGAVREEDLGAFPSLVEYFKRFVQTHEGQLSETELAKRLGISRKALWERRQRFNLPRQK